MLLNIKTGRGVPKLPVQEIVCLITSTGRLVEQGHRFVTTGGNACARGADFFDSSQGLAHVDWDLLRCGNFRPEDDDPNRMVRYMAEALVHRRLPLQHLLGLAVVDSGTQQTVRATLGNAFSGLPVEIRPQFFFVPR